MDANVSKNKPKGKGGLPVIRCSCGAEILLVANIKLMGEAIEAHVEKHKQKVKEHKEAEAERIRNDLIVKLLDKASET